MMIGQKPTFLCYSNLYHPTLQATWQLVLLLHRAPPSHISLSPISPSMYKFLKWQKTTQLQCHWTNYLATLQSFVRHTFLTIDAHNSGCRAPWQPIVSTRRTAQLSRFRTRPSQPSSSCSRLSLPRVTSLFVNRATSSVPQNFSTGMPTMTLNYFLIICPRLL